MTFRERLDEIDNGRFKKLFAALPGICDSCEGCDYFNPTIKDSDKRYRCHVLGSCPAATISKDGHSYIWWKLGVLSQDEHHRNLGIAPRHRYLCRCPCGHEWTTPFGEVSGCPGCGHYTLIQTTQIERPEK